MNEIYTTKEGLEKNLELTATNINMIAAFLRSEKKKNELRKVKTLVRLLYMDVVDGVFKGKEEELFNATLPLCKHYNSIARKLEDQIGERAKTN